MDQNNINGFIEISKAIEPYVKAYGTYSTAFVIGSKFVPKVINYVKGLTQRQYYDINEIFNQIDAQNINIGDLLETSGFILKYGQVFKPYTHIHAMFSNCKKGDEKVIYKNGQKLIQCKMELSSKVFQPPIQKIPSFNGIGCAFIYDSRFQGFIHSGNENAEEQKNRPLVINEYSKPIMVLYDIAKQEKYINREVLLKGRVISIPMELVKNLNGIFDNSIREICSNFFRPYNENNNFICISLLDSECSIKEVSKIKDIAKFGAPLYVEAQMEGIGSLNKDEVQKVIESILPNLPQKLDPAFPLTVGTYTNNIGIPFLSIDNINVVFREPEIIGFYTETNIFDPEEYRKGLDQLTTFIKNFSIDYKNVAKKHLKGKPEMKLNFLFDYEKQYLFDKRGALNSEYAKYLYENDESSRYIMDWLKNDRVLL